MRTAKHNFDTACRKMKGVKGGHVFNMEKWDVLKISAPILLRVKSHEQLDPQRRETNCGRG